MLIVGGANIQKLKEKLSKHCFDEVIHVSGRKTNMVRAGIPVYVELILVITDFVNRTLSAIVKKRANEQSVSICFTMRSWSSIHREVEKQIIKSI